MRIAQIVCASLVTGLMVMPVAASAQDTQALAQQIDPLQRDIERLRQEYAARLAELEAKLAAVQTQAPPAAPVPAEPPPPAPAAPEAPGAAQAAVGNSKVFNPDMAVIGDFLGAAGSNPVQPDPFSPGSDHPSALQMHESEASFQAVVDPYARADFFISFGEEGVDLEEGFITFTSLPGGLLTRVGKMRAAFGKVNTLHNHVLSWVDRPLVTNYLVGGEDGINDAGLSVTRILPAPKWLFLEGTAQVFRGDSADVFKSTVKNDVSVIGHIRGYRDLTESTNLDIGLSYGRGHNDLGSQFLTNLYGVDATLRWKPLRRSIYHSFVGRSEFIWSHRNQLPTTNKSFGFYASGDYQLARRWYVGGRYDRSGRQTNSALVDDGGSIVLTYWPSEFSQLRGQYRLTNFAEGIKSNEFLMQLMFSLGAHGAHPF